MSLLSRRLIDRSGVTLVNRGSLTSSTSSLTTYTFSSYGIGTASSTRRVVVGVIGNSTTINRTLSSATIGGVSASIHAQITDSGGASNSTVAAVISATVSSGTTANIALTFSGSMNGAAVYGVAIDNLNSTTAYDTLTDSTGPTVSGSIDWAAEGFVLGMASINDSATSWTWTGLNEQGDIDVGGALRITCADIFSTSTVTNTTVSAVSTSFNLRSVLAVAAFR